MIPIAIVAHPSRTEWVTALSTAVQVDAVCWDQHDYGAAFNHLQAWEWLASSGEEWGVVLEDDVIPCPNFRLELRDAIVNAPTDALSLYLGRGRPPGVMLRNRVVPIQEKISAAIMQDASYLTFPGLLSGQGYALKTELFQKYREMRNYVSQSKKPIDTAIGNWLKRKQRVDVSYCRFSLVDHRDGPTLIDDHGDGQPRNGLTALWVEGCGESGKDLLEVRKAWMMSHGHTDWTRGSVPLCPKTLPRPPVALGEESANAKLTEDDVRWIRAQTDLSHREMAARFGVARSTIARILWRKGWRHVV